MLSAIKQSFLTSAVTRATNCGDYLGHGLAHLNGLSIRMQHCAEGEGAIFAGDHGEHVAGNLQMHLTLRMIYFSIPNGESDGFCAFSMILS